MVRRVPLLACPAVRETLEKTIRGCYARVFRHRPNIPIATNAQAKSQIVPSSGKVTAKVPMPVAVMLVAPRRLGMCHPITSSQTLPLVVRLLQDRGLSSIRNAVKARF
jgi:hypothetical protein